VVFYESLWYFVWWFQNNFIGLHRLSLSRAEQPAKKQAGFFMPCYKNMRHRTPVLSVNAPTALEVIDNGKGGAVLFIAAYKSIKCLSNGNKTKK
jgi:hypothetical protein